MKYMSILPLIAASLSAFAIATPNKIDLPPYFSQYTSLAPKDCVTLDSDSLHPNPEIDFYEAECPAFGGYQLTVGGGDLRYHVGLSYNGKSIELVSPPSFHDVGAKAEWRFKRIEKTGDGDYKPLSAEPIGLIYRLNMDSYDENTGKNKTIQELVVVRLKGSESCVIGRVKQSGKMNIEAQALADKLDAKCVTE